jgi:YD repeat-containing protein
METSSFCPRCGSRLANGLCPVCGAPQTNEARPAGKTRSPRAREVITIVVAAYMLAMFAFIFFARHQIIDYFKGRRAFGRSSVTARTLQHVGPVARIDELKGSGRLYLVQIGDHRDPYSVDDFARWLHTKYGLDVQVLPALPSDPSTFDSVRNQYVAELLMDQIKHAHPDLASDPNAYLFGFTDADMYIAMEKWNSTFTSRDLKRAAVISSEGMEYGQAAFRGLNAADANAVLQKRLRRILLKDVAMLYWHLPLNNDPSSNLRQPLNTYAGTEDIYESDLEPAKTLWGQNEGEPCIFMIYSAKSGLNPLPGRLIHTCGDVKAIDLDESQELFEIDLRLGILIDEHREFNLPGTIPIEFQRALRDHWRGLNPYGVSGADDYDESLASADSIQISIVHADTMRENLMLAQGSRPNAADSKYVDADFSGRYDEMHLIPGPLGHYEVRRFDGVVRTYLPYGGPGAICYLNGFRDAQGHELKFERDEARRLTRLSAPDNQWLQLSYVPSGISEIRDNRGRTVRYGYDERHRLVRVTYPSGEVYSYQYDDVQHLLTFSVARNEKAPQLVLMRNEYADQRLVKQTLADGEVYAYSYGEGGTEPTRKASVRAPGGRQFTIQIGDVYSKILEQDSSAKQ